MRVRSDAPQTAGPACGRSLRGPAGESRRGFFLGALLLLGAMRAPEGSRHCRERSALGNAGDVQGHDAGVDAENLVRVRRTPRRFAAYKRNCRRQSDYVEISADLSHEIAPFIQIANNQ